MFSGLNDDGASEFYAECIRTIAAFAERGCDALVIE